MRHPAFTLIELLVVIAIIGILSVLVVTQLGNSSIKARNATAQSDIAEMGKAVESFRVDDIASGKVVSNIPSSVDSLSGTAGSLPSAFNGTQSASALTYAATVSKTPSSAYTYRYVAPGTPAASAAGTNRQLVAGVSGQPLYALCANLVNAANPYYCVAEGSGGNLSNSDQALASEGLGNLSAAATTGLVAWYKLDESGTAAVASDSSGNGNNGSLANFTFDGTTNGWATGKFGNGLLFNGTSKYVSVVLPQQISAPFTVSAWVNMTAFSGANTFIWTRSNGNYFDLKVRNNNSLHGDLGAGSSWISTSVDAATPTLSLNTWYHVTYSITPTAASIYLNGTLIATVSLGGTGILVPAGGTFNIASSGETFNGTIDEVRIYSRALSTGEVQQLYQGTL